MTILEWTLLPVAIAVVLLLLQGAFYRSGRLAMLVSLAGLCLSALLGSGNAFSQLALVATAVII